jgi:hypothetical protein
MAESAWRSLHDVIDDARDQETEALGPVRAVPSPTDELPCLVAGCDRTFTRGAALASHMRSHDRGTPPTGPRRAQPPRPGSVVDRLLADEPPEPPGPLNRPQEALFHAISEDLKPIAEQLRAAGWSVDLVAVHTADWFGVRLEVCLEP